MNPKIQSSHLLFASLIFCLLGIQSTYALSVTIESPRNGARFESCADITLKAKPEGIPDADIKRIVFYSDGRVVKSVRTSPWEYTMESVADGIYEVYAKLTDNSNETVSSETIQLFVGPVEDGDKIKNGEFACGTSPWTLALTGDAFATLEIETEGWLSDESSMAVIEIDNPGTENWHVMLTQPCPIDSGHFYDISFIAEVEDDKNIGVDFQSTTGTYPVHFWQTVLLTSDTYEYGPIEFFCPVTDPSNEFKLAISEDNKGLFIDAIKVIDRNWVKNETGVEGKSPIVVTDFELRQNYPNPFNPSTEIKFVLPQNEHVNLSIYNVKGQRVKTLIDAPVSAGSHAVSWDGRDSNVQIVTSGVYIYELQTASHEMSKRMLMIK